MTMENAAFHFCDIGSTTRMGNPREEVSRLAATEKRRPSPCTQSKLPLLTTEKIKFIIVMLAKKVIALLNEMEREPLWHYLVKPRGYTLK